MGDSTSDSEEFETTDLVHQFMAVTGAEDTVALSYLQQSSWNVEVCSTDFLANISASPFLNHQNCRMFNFFIFQSAINKFFDSLFTRGGHGSKENPVLVSDNR